MINTYGLVNYAVFTKSLIRQVHVTFPNRKCGVLTNILESSRKCSWSLLQRMVTARHAHVSRAEVTFSYFPEMELQVPIN